MRCVSEALRLPGRSSSSFPQLSFVQTLWFELCCLFRKAIVSTWIDWIVIDVMGVQNAAARILDFASDLKSQILNLKFQTGRFGRLDLTDYAAERIADAE